MSRFIRTVGVLSLVIYIAIHGGVIGQERVVEGRGVVEVGLAIKRYPGELELLDSDKVFAKFSWQDADCKRPFFHNFSAPDGTALTRNYPPKDGVDATDHSTMHGGIWLGFGDINGEDFWRNRGSVVQDEFTQEPIVRDGRIEYQTKSFFVDREDRKIGTSVQTFRVARIGQAYGIYWSAQMRAMEPNGGGVLAFGDQEEMGLGVRLATPLIEKNGGEILNSEGLERAQGTWGKSARWVDYSRVVDGNRVGMTLIPLGGNPRESWFHNRDYGLMVANLFGRQSMTGGEKSVIEVISPRSIQIEYIVLGYSMPLGEFGEGQQGRRSVLDGMVERFVERLTDR